MRKRTPGWHFAGANSGIRFVALPLTVPEIDRHHLRGVASRRADLNAATTKFANNLQRAGDQFRIGRQAFDLLRNELSEHLVDIFLARIAAVLLVPATPYRFETANALDVNPLVRSHRHARLLERDRDTLALKHFHEYNRRGAATKVHCGSCPVKEHRLNWAAITTGVTEGHFLLLNVT